MNEQESVAREMTAIWCEVLDLGADEMDPDESLFEVGGTSLQAVKLMTRIQEAFGVELELTVVFAEGSVARLTELVEADLLAELDALEPAEVERLLREEAQNG
ncbi:hypothetical protein SRB5_29960 [Streptomyces sp. RB5]|uniref:Carrier domain-containing protein n=1 Tax=Streptomyces smaragdinus TaxID=2585196 RepID=A0A7K0CH96_9ACTN|nr:acyl carrier protein [Streptomyces smaragdinus]MQY12857.1 hypothetical protein [Streptomyces smaragdinus]